MRIINTTACLLGLALAAVSCGKTDEEKEMDKRASAEATRMVRQPDPVAAAVAMKYGVGTDTIVAIMETFAKRHDTILEMEMSMQATMEGRESEGFGKTMPDTMAVPVHKTARELAQRFGFTPGLIGAIVYDYKAAASDSSE